MNILITSVGRRVSLVKAFQKELKAIFRNGQVMVTDFNVSLSAGCQVADCAFQMPLVEDKNYINILLDICLKQEIKLVIPTIDTELLILAKHSNMFNSHGIMVIVSSESFIEVCRNKRDTHLFFKKHDIQVAREYPKLDYSLPLFIKPLRGSRSVDTHIIKHEEELTSYHFKNPNLMFLEYLDHNNFEEFTCDLYYDKQHHLKCVVPRKRIEVRDGEVSKGLTVKNELVPYITSHLDYIEGVIGCLTTQFFKHKLDGSIFGIEINARFGGGFPLTYLAGANYVKWIIQEYFLNQPVTVFNDWESNLLMLRYDNEILVHDYKK
ncbi:ATP-grasp domain-containing protein [Gaetbulibacter aquiaggeris]|uniref:ATP-grasp domain-containing protein n=1 Tax=Gaetbulibacter aquiaggeris TaxID=1735373 RepID=A0ABW7MQU7_9FLAO